jgi:hypothetical protein
MHPFYSLMGLIAKASNKMSRNQVNGLALNWWIILVCGFVGLVASEARQDAVSNGTTPQKMTVAQFLQLGRSDFKHRYVSVTGILVPPLKIDVSKGSDHFDLVPLIDPATKSGFFVRSDDGVHNSTKAEKVTLTGMMWGLPSDLQGKLGGSTAKFAPINMDSSLELSEGQTPGSPLATTACVAVAALIGGLFLFSSLRQHVFFRRTASKSAVTETVNSPFSGASALRDSNMSPAVTAGTDAQDTLFNLTGQLRLNEKVASRFMEVPVQLLPLDDGKKAFASRIDASERMYGQVTQSKVGVWLSVPETGTLQMEEGLLYTGAIGQPALRVSYLDSADKNKKKTTVLSFATAEQRAAVQKELASQGVKS